MCVAVPRVLYMHRHLQYSAICHIYHLPQPVRTPSPSALTALLEAAVRALDAWYCDIRSAGHVPQVPAASSVAHHSASAGDVDAPAGVLGAPALSLGSAYASVDTGTSQFGGQPQVSGVGGVGINEMGTAYDISGTVRSRSYARQHPLAARRSDPPTDGARVPRPPPRSFFRERTYQVAHDQRTALPRREPTVVRAAAAARADPMSCPGLIAPCSSQRPPHA